ncbi:MAG TPA: HEAT repeat domain-containing protein [Planktothrix sp.]|jgi:hypothetical protein
MSHNEHPAKGHETREITDPSVDLQAVQVRRVVAGNPNTPKQVLARLATDESHEIRRIVSENPKTGVDVLHKLAYDTHTDVRLAVAENRNTPSETLAILSKDDHVDVRYGVAENPHMPEQILFELCQDDNPYVRCRALKTMQALDPDVVTRMKALLQRVYLGSLNTEYHKEAV